MIRNPINKRIPRLLREKPAHYIPLFILLLVTIIIISSFFIVQGSVENIYHNYLESGKAEDGQFTTLSELSLKTKRKLEKQGVKLYENFYVELDNKKAGINIYKLRKNVNIPVVTDGRLPEKRNEIALDHNYCLSNSYNVGDKINLGRRSFNLVGKIVLPDYIAMMKNVSDPVMDTLNFGAGLVSDTEFETFQDKSIHYNYVYLENLKSGSKKEAADKLKDLTKIVSEENVLTDALTRAQNKRISYLIDDMGGDAPMMKTILIIAVLSIAFIFAMQTKNLVESESSVIGSLMASGYGKKELVFHYTILPMTVVLSAAVIGNILTYTCLYNIYTRLYYLSFSLPPFRPEFNAYAFLFTTLVPVGAVLIINLLLLIKKLSLSPLRFLRHDLSGKTHASHVSFRSIGFMSGYKIKVLLNNKLNAVVLLFGVTLAGIFLSFGLGLRPLFEGHAESMMHELPARYQSYVRGENAQINEEKFASGIFEIPINKTAYTFQVYGISDNSKYFDNKALSELSPNEIQASEGLMEKLNLKVGELVEAHNPYTDEIYHFTIRSVRKNTVSLSAYMPINYFNKIMGYDQKYFSGYFSDKRPDIDERSVVSIVDREMVGKVAQHFLETFGSMIGPIIFISVLFYFVFLYLLSKTIIEKSETDISYLKIFGFTNREISGIYLDASGIILGIYLLLSPIILKEIMAFVMTQSMKKFDFYIAPYLPNYVYFVVAVTGALIFLAVQVLQMRRISKISMTEALKEVSG